MRLSTEYPLQMIGQRLLEAVKDYNRWYRRYRQPSTSPEAMATYLAVCRRLFEAARDNLEAAELETK